MWTYNIYDKRIPPRLAAWQKELQFRPASIWVAQFFIAELGIGIADYPAHFSGILDDEHASDEEKADIRESVRQWDADGQYVLYWGKDYWLNLAGKVVSS